MMQRTTNVTERFSRGVEWGETGPQDAFRIELGSQLTLQLVVGNCGTHSRIGRNTA